MIREFTTVLERWKYEAVELIPKMLISLMILCIGYIIARILKYAVRRAVNYFGVFVNRRFKSLNFEQAASFTGAACFWLVIFCAVLLITDVLGLTILTIWFQDIIQYLPNLLAAVLIVLASIILGNLLFDLVSSVSERAGLEYGQTLAKITKYSLIFMAIIIALDQIGIEISLLINIIDIVLAAVLFGAALAFGLGARTSISNVLAAYYVRKMYNEGDEIQIGEVRGVILKIDSTVVLISNETGQVAIPTKIFNETTSYLISKV